MTKTQELKQPIRQWLKLFPDDRLVALLAHAQDGKLAYMSCCCLAGALNAPHALEGKLSLPDLNEAERRHLFAAWELHDGLGHKVDCVYKQLGWWKAGDFIIQSDDRKRRRILVPMIRSEIWQREHRKSLTQHHPVLSLTINPMEVVAEQELLNVPTAL